MLESPWHAQNEALGRREMPFSGSLYIEQDDFSLDPPKKWKRLAPGEMVRLRYGYIIRCDEVVREGDQIIELKCTYFADSRSGQDTSGLKPNGVIHFVSAEQAVAVDVNVYERLFQVPNPKAETFLDDINPNSLSMLKGFVEPAIMAHADARFQFERIGYFCKDAKVPNMFNKTVSLREGF